MIVQAIKLLDDLDKELNSYMMRIKEWYGWHFPELTKILTSKDKDSDLNENLLYAKTVLKIKSRTEFKGEDLTDILPEDLSTAVLAAIKVSMGTEINEEDVNCIVDLAKEVIELTEYRSKLFEYLKNRMQAIAPNLTHLVGELVGARLISHAGSLINLAKQPSSTVQILGAEKALFRALKAKQNTPKYGLIYHASLIGQAGQKNKGKIARVLAAKCSLSSRVDALGEKEQVSIGIPSREVVEKRIASLDSFRSNSFDKVQTKGVKQNVQTDRNVEIPSKLKTTEKEEKKRKREKEEDSEKKKKE